MKMYKINETQTRHVLHFMYNSQDRTIHLRHIVKHTEKALHFA